MATASAAAAEAHLRTVGNLSPNLREVRTAGLVCSTEAANDIVCRHAGQTARCERTSCLSEGRNPRSTNAARVSADGCPASEPSCWAASRCFVMLLTRSKLPQFCSSLLECPNPPFLRPDQQLTSCFWPEAAAASGRPARSRERRPQAPLPPDDGSCHVVPDLCGCAYGDP